MARRNTVGSSSSPTARVFPPALHVRIAAAVASAPNRQNQPTSPGCSCTAAPSRCHAPMVVTKLLSCAAVGVDSVIVT